EESVALVGGGEELAVCVDRLTVVFYECRCLERRLLQHPLALAAAAPLDSSPPDAAELARVRGVVAEADHPDYWFLASKDGSREAHYRGSALGVTLVHDLEPFRTAQQPPQQGQQPAFGSDLPGVVRAFRRRVDEELPGLYRWFGDASLHSTVRSLMG
ncbi:hypothetical protein TSOC_014398, partial [Tetrabaena socialis]